MSASARDAEATKALTQPLITPQAVGNVQAQQLAVPATVIDVPAQPLVPATQPQPVPDTQPPPASAPDAQSKPQIAPGLLEPQRPPAPITEQPLTAEATGGQGRIPTGQLLVNKTFRSTANLANYLPTGTMLAFQLLSPVFTNLGMCDVVFQTCLSVFLALCIFSCMIFTFTDSFVDSQGLVRYGFATFNGIWVVDGTPPPPDAAKYRITFTDVVHAIMTAAIFVAVAVIDPRVLLCLRPDATSYETLFLKLVPIFLAVLFSALFIVFPTNRHGIGFPIAPH